MHWAAIFAWLVANNLWKAQVAFWVTLLLGGLVTLLLRPWRAYKKHRQLQERIADSLDTSTPGGLAEVVQRLDRLLREEQEGHGGIIPRIEGGNDNAGHR